MIKLEPLTGRHDRNTFDCGIEPLNVWLKQTAMQHQNRGISRTVVTVPQDRDAVETYSTGGYPVSGITDILGFYALASALVLLDELPQRLAKRFPRQIPVTRLGRLAVRSDVQGQGLGKLLLIDAINKARNAALVVGSAGIMVDAKDDAAACFYQTYGFIPCGLQPRMLFMPLW
ncbi:GNAT family N-acetyltransferase [Acerihabitans sp. KWT182]|uniref:GNAT family N-acetyltransferase n=1 Tax=Acerihabitans sp. KWT182 TaxID=3157919 RepID=A0AAU7QAA4_9GAMM